MRSAELLAACERGDEVRIEQLGWRPVLDALRCWPKRLNGAELAPYARALGDLDPSAVAKAVLDLAAAEWRPSAAVIYRRLHPAEAVAAAAPPRGRSDTSPEAYRAVLDWVAMGEEVCDCHPRSPNVTIDAAGVLRCEVCDRLEPGQYDAAMEGDA